MTDKQPSPNPKFKQPKKLMTKSNIIGLGVLGLGLLAIIWVGSMAYNSFFGVPSTEEASKRQGNSSRKISGVPNRAAGERAQAPIKTYKRQDSIALRDMAGTWQAKLSKGIALLEIRKSSYRLIVITDKTSLNRSYSNGTIEIDGDIVVLRPNLKLGPPKSKQPYRYRILTRGSIPVAAGKHQGKLVFQSPPDDADIYIPSYNPILSRGLGNIVVWELLK